MVGVNEFVSEDEGSAIPTLKIDEEVQTKQCADLAKVKAERDDDEVREALNGVREAARGTDNMMPPIIRAAKAYCTEQEICDVLRDVMGAHSDNPEF